MPHFSRALIAMPLYGGAAYDKNGYQPFNAPIPIIAKKWDANVTIFSVQLVYPGGRIARGDRSIHPLIEMKSRAAGKARTPGAI